MSLKHINITQAQFASFFKLDEWHVYDIPKEYWGKIPGIQRLNDTFAIMGSAAIYSPQTQNSINDIIAGIDVLTLEKNPKTNKNELPGNAYHYIFQSINDSDFPYIMHGPYTEDKLMKIPHWFNAEDLDEYWPEKSSPNHVDNP